MKIQNEICISFAMLSTMLCNITGLCEPRAIIDGSDSANFGSYPAKESRSASFAIANKGDAPLKIIGVRNTCECVEPSLSIGSQSNAKSCEIPPGSKATLMLKVLPDSIYEAYDKVVYVQTDDTESKFLIFKISGDPVPILKAIPHAEVLAGHIHLGATWRHELKLTATADGVELGEPEMESDLPISAAIVKGASGNDYALKIEAEPTLAPPGRFSSKIAIPIIKPEGWKPLAVIISGYLGVELVASPAKLFIAKDRSAQAKRKIELRTICPEPFRFTAESIQVSAPHGVEVKLSGKGQGCVEVEIRMSDEIASLDERNRAIEFKLPSALPLRVPIVLQ